MRKGVLIILLLGIFLLSTVYATEYYVDCSQGTKGVGSYENPWNNIGSVNGHAMQTGDDVYFKVGTTCTMPAILDINWNGIENDPVVIGCYESKNNFDCSGLRPVLDGNSIIPSTDKGLIYKNNGQYVEINYLKIYRSGEMGISMKIVDYAVIRDCQVSYNQRHGIWVKGNYAIIDNNIITQNAQVNNPSAVANMGALVLTGQSSVINGGIISRNIVFNDYGTEAISLNRKVNGVIVEKNVVYDNKANMGIYLDAVQNISVRDNLIYYSSDVGNWKRGSGINVNNEPYGYCYTGEHKIYNNLIASASNGISIGSDQENCPQSNNLYYENVIIDSTLYNFRFWPSGLGGSGNVINNNILLSISGGNNANSYSPEGYVWNNNVFYGGSSASGNALNDAVLANPQLQKISDWHSIPAGTADPNWFKPLAGSPAINNGTPLGSQYNTDFLGVTRPQGSAWDIGAFEYIESISQINILPLGDSITYGSNPGGDATRSYRYYLWNLLENEEYNIDFIGSLTGPQDVLYTGMDYNHEGHPGWTANMIASNLNGWLTGYNPDIVLLHIGHNDFWSDKDSPSTIISDVSNIIDILQADNPNVAILLAQIIYPSWSVEGDNWHQLNAQIPSLAASKTTEQSLVIAVDHNRLFDPSTDYLSDGAHPNENGNQKISQQWHDDLIPILSYCGDEVCEGGEVCGETDVAPECNSDCGICSSVNELISHWNFDEGTGTIAHDSSGNNNHGTVNGATWTNGKINNALNFNGVDDYVSVGSDSSLKPVSSVTTCAWTKLSGDGDRDYPQIIGFDTRGYEIDYNEIDDKFNFWVYTNDWGTEAETTSTFTASTEWIHICGTYDGSTLKLYLNGVKQTDGANTGNINYNSDLHIGGTELTGSYYNGIIDDVRIYNYALPDSEVLDLYNEGASDCSSGADGDGDSVVSIGELINYISSWKSGSVLIGELISAIGEWKNGC